MQIWKSLIPIVRDSLQMCWVRNVCVGWKLASSSSSLSNQCYFFQRSPFNQGCIWFCETFSIKCTLKVWIDVRDFPGFASSVPSLHHMSLKLWGVINEKVPKNVLPWIVYVFGPLIRISDGLSVALGLWNFLQLKCLVIHAWEMCFECKFASHL